MIFFIRLFYLQVIDDTYKQIADDRGLRKQQVDPDRGQILDRNGKLIVYNEPSYKLMVVPAQVGVIDTARFCEILGIDKAYFVRKMKDAIFLNSRVKESVFMSQISAEDFGRIEEYLYEFKGFYPAISPVRKYTYPCAAHLLGYVAEVDSNDIKKSNGYYRNADMIGKSGVEKSYEYLLRGQKGYRNVVIDRFGREVGPLNNGEEDVAPIAGKNLTLTIDIELQQYAEQLLANKRGALVAIEPSTGEILALVSTPSYDPNMLVGSARTKNFAKLALNKENPLNNRALSGYYPPGSTFKPVMAAISMDIGSLTADQGYSCPGGYVMSGHKVDCHNHPYASNVELGIGHSCNAYFCYAFKYFMEAHDTPVEGMQDFKDHLGMWGIGTRTGVDLPNERNGNVPDPEDYDKVYGKGRWKASNCVTLGIGQDKLIVTPLQSANSMAIIANGGYFYTPHVLKYADDADTVLAKFLVRRETGIADSIFPYVQHGMAGAVNFGTARIAQVDSIQVCGKTGTAENPHGKSHSWFSCFAPEKNPQIAVAIIVENAGWGASYAAPIASLVVEKYVNGKISEKRKALEERMMKAVLIDTPLDLPPVQPIQNLPVDSNKNKQEQQPVQAAVLPKKE
ncbi:MAG: penicillin-binding protein 2 [Bacteroidetes bacterium]|nr:penicillin-binding protein 2 [Bacteroidota bacterium]